MEELNMNGNVNRKHYRVYTKKNHPDTSEESGITIKGNKAIFGLIGFAFIKGLLWGYILKGKQKKK